MTTLPLPRIIAGVDSRRQVRVEVEIQGLYRSTPYGAVLDTGFSGGLSIPLVVAVGIGLAFVIPFTTCLAMAAGRERRFSRRRHGVPPV